MPELDEVKAHLLCKMSHELRTPLTNILGSAALLAATPLSREQRTLLANVQSEAGALKTLVDDALLLMQLEAGAVEIDTHEVDIGRTLEGVVRRLEPHARKKALSLTLQCLDLPPLALIDELRLTQLVTNLVSNAIKFTSAGSIAVTARWSQGRLLCDIRDTGKGFPLNDVARLFRPFEQGDEHLDRESGGAGLGLAICADLAAVMQGALKVENGPERGAILSLSIPAPAAQPHAVAAPDLETHLKVLVAEDNPTIRMLLSQILGAVGCDVALAVDGLEAVGAVAREDFDLCLMDLRMPNLDGFAALDSIRQLRRDLPVVAVSAEICARARQAGFDGFLSKPLEPERILQMVEQYRPTRSEVARADQVAI